MARESFRKVKLLKLLEMLQQNTDEQHPMTTGSILAHLSAMEIPCDRRTLAQDIATLRQLDYEIMTSSVGHEKAYYVADRNFSVPELKILIDAVQASAFITEKKTKELVEKLAVLGGNHRAELLKGNMVCFNTRKHSNEQIFYNVDALEKAIEQQKKVLFRYFTLNEKGKKVYRRDGHRYVVEPVALVFNEDNYYVMTYSSRHESTATYRLDRMEAVSVIEEPICDKAVELRREMAQYTEQVFKMYGGQPEDVVLEFQDGLIGVVFDKFGEDTPMMRVGESKCVATVKVRISPTFWGWLFQFAGEMRVLSPQWVIDGYRQQAKKLEE
jgi:predicted DNA-binding transcriptional regulator YafY